MKQSILHAVFFTPMSEGFWGLPLTLWGAPGTTKTAHAKKLAKMMGVPFEVLSPGERGEGAFGVTPMPTVKPNGKTILSYPAPDWTEKFEELGEGLVVVDEIGSCPPAIQPALLGLVQERRVGGYQLPKRVRVIGAGNPANMAAGGWDIAPPVANRMGHIQWDAPDADEWGSWLLGSSNEEGSKLDVSKEEKRVLAAWPEAFARAAGLVSAFVKRRPELLHKMPAEGDAQASRAWPSPRTWEYATRALASSMVHGLDEVATDELLSAFIGNGAAGEFATWREQTDLPDPADVLDGKVKFVAEETRMDRTLATLSACSALVHPAKAEKREERAKMLWKLLGEVMGKTPDLVVPAMRNLIDAKLQKVDGAVPVMAKLNPVVTAAGLTGRR